MTNDEGLVAGVIDIVVDTTQQSQNRRRLQLLSRLTAAVADLAGPKDLSTQALPVLRSVPQDLPTVDVYLSGDPTTGHEGRLPARPSTALDGRALVLEDDGAGLVAWLPLGDPTSPHEPHDDVTHASTYATRRASDPGSGVLLVRLSENLEPAGNCLDFLVLVAGTLTRALDRALAREVERGDRYDAFLTPTGTLTVVIGDVTGHDRHAAAAMAQVPARPPGSGSRRRRRRPGPPSTSVERLSSNLGRLPAPTRDA